MTGPPSTDDRLTAIALRAPELAAELRALDPLDGLPAEQWAVMLRETLAAWIQEPAFGRAVARGFAALAGLPYRRALERFAALVRQAVREGPTFGRILATQLPPILLRGDEDLLEAFLAALAALKSKGTYALDAPLSLVARWAHAGDLHSARALARLLATVFIQPLPYNRCQQLASLIPTEAARLEPRQRAAQLGLLRQVMDTDQGLAEAFLQGLSSDLGALPSRELASFVAEGLRRHAERPEGSPTFFALRAFKGRQHLGTLRTRVALEEVRTGLSRYLRARTGNPIVVRPLSTLARQTPFPEGTSLAAFSDGRCLYLPDEIDRAGARERNEGVYKLLVRLEAGLWEWGTFAFDLQRARMLCAKAGLTLPRPAAAAVDDRDERSGLSRFLGGFDDYGLAVALFTLFEHARLNRYTARYYPGLEGITQEALAEEMVLPAGFDIAFAPFLSLYGWTVPTRPVEAIAAGPPPGLESPLRSLANRAALELAPPAPVERVAPLVLRAWPFFAALGPPATTWSAAPLPFGRRIRPDLFDRACRRIHPLMQRLCETLGRAGVEFHPSQARAFLVANDGLASPEVLEKLIAHRAPEARPDADQLRSLWQDVDRGGQGELDTLATAPSGGAAFHYAEWDCQAGDYIADHVRLREIPAATGDSAFFRQTLERRYGLVQHLRRTFERLRPERLSTMRRWIEGDDLDPATLSDYLIERRAGQMPDERLYMKRIKSIRDIATLLLVDISRSTAHRVGNGNTTVLDIEKEAMVLFAEALAVLGDPFAMAAFSGSGPWGVEYLRIKDFDEGLDAAVRARIGGLAPRRNTRMGAAIRHAVSRLENVAARGRLLILLGDGFPNDTQYRGRYAVEDTARALTEARAGGIHAHALTVAPSGDGRLDRLYGALHYHMIADVADLPAQLLQIYRHLTRR